MSTQLERPPEGRSLFAYVARCRFCDKTVSMLSPDYAQWRHRNEIDAADPTVRETFYFCPNHLKQAEPERSRLSRFRRALGL